MEQLLLQKQQQIEGSANGKDVISTSESGNSPVYARDDDEVETKSVGVMAGSTKLAHTDDDDDAATSDKQAPKRQRFDSDSVASTYLKRMQPPKQEPREVGHPKALAFRLLILIDPSGPAAHLWTDPRRSNDGEHDHRIGGVCPAQ